MPVQISVTIQNGTEVRQRLANLAQAASVIGSSKTKVGSDLLYSRFVVEGTRAHDIYPRNGKALFWPGASHPVKHVHHPGTSPNPFMEHALASTRGAVELFVANQLDSVASGGGSNYSQIMPGATKLLLEAVKQDAPVGKTGNLRRSFYVS